MPIEVIEMGRNAQKPVNTGDRERRERKVSDRTKLMRAEMELASGRPGGAIELAQRMLKDDPHHVGALEILAKAQWQIVKCEDLLGTLGRLIELNPYEPGYHSLQAAAYQSLGLCGQAVKSYLRAVDLGMPKSEEMVAMLEDLRAWQGSLVAGLIREDPVFRAAYEQNPALACASRGFDFAIPPETTETIIQDRQVRAMASVRPS